MLSSSKSKSKSKSKSTSLTSHSSANKLSPPLPTTITITTTKIMRRWQVAGIRRRSRPIMIMAKERIRNWGRWRHYFLTMIQSVSLTQLLLFNIICIATSTAATVWWNALGNKLGMDSNLSESSTSENVEEIEKGTRRNWDQEDIHVLLINICLCYILRIQYMIIQY